MGSSEDGLPTNCFEYTTTTGYIYSASDLSYRFDGRLGTGDITLSATVVGYPRVQMSGTIYKVKDNAFEGIPALETFRLPDSVTHIGSAAFYNCTSLTDFDMGNGVQDIGTNAFYGCSALSKINLPETITS